MDTQMSTIGPAAPHSNLYPSKNKPMYMWSIIPKGNAGMIKTIDLDHVRLIAVDQLDDDIWVNFLEYICIYSYFRYNGK